MSDGPPAVRAGAAVLAAALVTLGGGAPAAATAQEQPRPTTGELRAVLDTLVPRWRRAALEKRRADSLRALARERERLALEEVRAGPLRILAPPGRTEEARALFRSAWEEHEARVGAAADGLGRFVVLYLADEVDHGWDTTADTVLSVGLGRWATPARLRQRVRGSVAEALTRLLPEVLQEWVGGARVGSEPEWPAVYRDLATAPSRVARACFEAGTACRAALGLEGREDGWTAWYTPAQLRHVLRARRHLFGGFGTDPELDACMRGDLGACDRFVRRENLPPRIPLASGTRASVVTFALQEGQGASYARLVEGTGTVEERLARAAGVAPDRLVEAWRRRVLRGRPPVHADLGRARWTVLIWTLALTFLATRSTRWRLG